MLWQHCVKSVQIRSYFWSVFSCIFRKYGRKLTPYLDNFHTVQKNPMPIISQDCFVVSKTWKSWVSLSSIFAFEIVFIRLSKKLGTSVYITLRKICEVCCLTSETKMCKSLFFDWLTFQVFNVRKRTNQKVSYNFAAFHCM